MRQSFICASVLAAASSVFAAPVATSYAPMSTGYSSPYHNSSASVTVSLVGQETVDTTFRSVYSRISQGLQSQGPFSTLEVAVGVAANQELRCQVLDHAGVPIAATRGANFDVTFSDGDGGIWTFDPPALVSVVLCDPVFVGKGFDVAVTLGSDVVDDSVTTLVNVVERVTSPPSGSTGPFSTFELSVGVNTDPALRCAINDIHGNAIFGTRGENRDTTFSDADKGPWALEVDNADVGEIICDPFFVADNRPL